jgi:hypothetical protein
MSGSGKKNKDTLIPLINALVEDVFATSDQEILAEFIETRNDPSQNSEMMRALFEKSIVMSNKDRLRNAQAGLAADRAAVAPAKIVSIANVRHRLRRALAACPPHIKLTLAARNESELSESDIQGMLQDLEELGIVIPDEQNDGHS